MNDVSEKMSNEIENGWINFKDEVKKERQKRKERRSNEIKTIKLASGETKSINIDLCMAESDDIFYKLWEQEETIDGFDFRYVVLSVFVESISILKDYGWTEEQLQRIIANNYPQISIEKLEKQTGCDLR